VTSAHKQLIVDAHRLFAGGGGEPPAEAYDSLRVASSVLIQAEPSDEATLRAMQQAMEDPAIVAVCAWTDVTSDGLEQALDDFATHEKWRGICLDLRGDSGNDRLIGERMMRGMESLERRNIPLDLIVQPRQLPAVAELARRRPALRVVLDHIGSPFIAKSEREPWGVYTLNVASHKNVFAKLSGLISLDTQPNWNVAHIALFVEAVVRIFGYERLMFGSDWPAHLEVAPFEQVLEATVASAGPMTETQERQLLVGTASAFYNIEAPVN